MQGNFLVFAHASPRACPRRASLVVRIQFKIYSNFVQYTPPSFAASGKYEKRDEIRTPEDIPKEYPGAQVTVFVLPLGHTTHRILRRSSRRLR
jgi:hypothetical protein